MSAVVLNVLAVVCFLINCNNLAEKQKHLLFIDSMPSHVSHCTFNSLHILGSVHNRDTRRKKIN